MFWPIRGIQATRLAPAITEAQRVHNLSIGDMPKLEAWAAELSAWKGHESLEKRFFLSDRIVQNWKEEHMMLSLGDLSFWGSESTSYVLPPKYQLVMSKQIGLSPSTR